MTRNSPVPVAGFGFQAFSALVVLGCQGSTLGSVAGGRPDAAIEPVADAGRAPPDARTPAVTPADASNDVASSEPSSDAGPSRCEGSLGVSAPVLLTPHGAVTTPGSAAVWNGSAYGMSFTYAPIGDPGRRSVYFQAVSATGSRLGDNVLVSDRAASEYSDLAWSGKGFGAIWLDVSSTLRVGDLRFTATDPLGAPTGPSVPLVAGVAIDSRWNPRVVWEEDHFAVSWSEPGPVSPTAFCLNVKVGRFTTAGAPIGAVVSPGCVSTSAYDVLWTGSGYVFAMADQFSPESTFRIVRVGLDGVTSEHTLPVPNANAPHLRLDGSELVLSWVDQGTLMTQRLDTGGAPLGAATTVFATGDQGMGLLATSGTDFLVVGASVHRIGATGTNEAVALPGSRSPVRLTFSGGQYVALIARTMNGSPEDVEFVRMGDCDATRESGLETPLGCLSPAAGGGPSDFACGPTARCQSRKEFCIIPSFDPPSCRPMPAGCPSSCGWLSEHYVPGWCTFPGPVGFFVGCKEDAFGNVTAECDTK